ncbi:MAG: T9SS type A sorting domain-containing protein [Bacteroidetes bacterium]|nr:T9SS type A sorting domain-containing protein [Bacteroidota bacterium]
MKKTLLLGLFLAVGYLTKAQNDSHCYTAEMVEQKLQQNPELQKNIDALEEFTQQYELSEGQNKTSAVITIPVVVHVLYQNTTQNVSLSLIQSQINVLNKDFRKLNSDTTKIPAAFKSLAADCEFQFCLAQRTPTNQPTNGVERKQVFVSGIGYAGNYYDASNGGLDAWNTSRYLNIWVCDINGGNPLGFAYPPGVASSADDGVVIDYRYFGTFTSTTNVYNMGRTASHEIGHYLNLRHIWGDDGSACSGTDNVADTPNQAGSSAGNPTFPRLDACTTTSPGVMYMNYMDYSNDKSLYMFTKGQKTRMQAAINGARALLKTSNGCSPLTSTETEEFLALTISTYPNPASENIVIEKNASPIQLENISIYSMLGALVYETPIEDNFTDEFNISLNQIPSGNYIIKAKTNLGVVNKKLQVIK